MQAQRIRVIKYDREQTCSSCKGNVAKYKELLVLDFDDARYTLCLSCAVDALLKTYGAAWREAEEATKVDPQEALSRIQESLEVHGAVYRERRETYGQKIDKRIEAIEAGLIQ